MRLAITFEQNEAKLRGVRELFRRFTLARESRLAKKGKALSQLGAKELELFRLKYHIEKTYDNRLFIRVLADTYNDRLR